MKTKVLLSIAAVAVLSVVSCQKENSGIAPESTPEIEVVKNVEPNPNFTPTKAFSFIGHTDNDFDPETKTSLDGTQVKWAVGDGIYLFDGTAPRAFVSDNGSVSATANFDGSAVVADKYYAIYPSGKISTVESKKVIATTIPTFQAATANSFAPKANVAVAYSETDPTGDAALQFKNIAAVVKFKINAENTDVRKVRLDAINGEDMTGAMNVTFNSDGTFSTASVHANSESCVILESESDSDLDPAQTYYMAIKPGTYAGGFKITLIREDGSFRSFNNTTSNTLERNDLVNLGELPKIPSWKAGTIDVLTGALINQDTYGSWENLSVTSTAKYAGYTTTGTGGNSGAIQMKSKDSVSGIVMTGSAGKVTKVSVVWSGGSTLDIYGKNTAYSSAVDLYSEDTDTKGALLGSIVNGTSTELNITGDYNYIGMRSSSGAIYLTSISVITGNAAPSDPEKTTQTTSITGLSSDTVPLTDGSATFNVDSNGPWTIASNHPEYASISVDESDVVTVTFENGTSERNATITVTPANGEAKDVTITQKDADVYSLYTSDLTEGDYILVGSSNHAMKNTITSSRMNYETVTIVSNQISDPASSIVWHISKSGDYWLIYNAAVDKYLACIKDTKNKAALIKPSTDYALWSASLSSNVFDFENIGRASDTTDPNNRYLRSNGASGFAGYATGTGTKISLYKKN